VERKGIGSLNRKECRWELASFVKGLQPKRKAGKKIHWSDFIRGRERESRSESSGLALFRTDVKE